MSDDGLVGNRHRPTTSSNFLVHLRLPDMRVLALFLFAAGLISSSYSFDITRNDNLAVYWGQNSAGSQQQLSSYCQDSTIDNVVLAFLYVFFGPAPSASQPKIDFSNACNQWDNPTFPGTELADCSFMASQIKACQAKGKIVTLSLGGATGQVGFSSASAAQSLATRIWNEFLGGSSSIRPFGNAVLDGLDLDIESGSSAYYDTFVNTIRSLSKGASKRYYVTAAPQCVFPDQWISDALNKASFDAVYVQFYNNYCGLDKPSDYNFATWDTWARTKSFNKNIKVYIGAPSSARAAGTGYVSPSKLKSYATSAQNSFKSMGGVMLWDASEAVANGNFHKSIKSSLVASGSSFSEPQGVDNPPSDNTPSNSPLEDSPFAIIPPAASSSDNDDDDERGVSRTGRNVTRPEPARVNSRAFYGIH